MNNIINTIDLQYTNAQKSDQVHILEELCFYKQWRGKVGFHHGLMGLLLGNKHTPEQLKIAVLNLQFLYEKH